MTITYPLSPPAGVVPSEANIIQVNVIAINASPFSLVQETLEHAGKAWRLDLAYPPLQGGQAREMLAFLTALKGRLGTFLHGDPLHTAPRGSGAGTPQVNGAGQTGNTLNTMGWTNGATGVLLKGDIFQLGSGATSRLYMALNDVDADGAGNATIDIWPNLRESPGGGSALVLTNPVGVFRLTANSTGAEERIGAFYSFELSAMEAL